MKTKKIISIILAALMLVSVAALSACGGDDKPAVTTPSGETPVSGEDTQAADDTTASTGDGTPVIVQTNAYFAPFEYYNSDNEIDGVDVEIMAAVSEKLGRPVEFQNVEFDFIIDNVAAGKVCDCGAAGITITDARREKVDFSVPYYTSVQYVVFPAGTMTVDGTDENGENYILWDQLAGKSIGVQRNTTGDFFVQAEIDEGGVIGGTGASVSQYDNGQLAIDAAGANQIDIVVIDRLPAQYITSKNSGYECAALFYKGAEGEENTPASEDYAIAVTKGNTELLDAINAVLTEMMETGDEGKNAVELLVEKHFGVEG